MCTNYNWYYRHLPFLQPFFLLPRQDLSIVYLLSLLYFLSKVSWNGNIHLLTSSFYFHFLFLFIHFFLIGILSLLIGRYLEVHFYIRILLSYIVVYLFRFPLFTNVPVIRCGIYLVFRPTFCFHDFIISIFVFILLLFSFLVLLLAAFSHFLLFLCIFVLIIIIRLLLL